MNILGDALPWIFTVADVKEPILGADFLSHHDISVNMKRRQLSHLPSNTTIQTKSIKPPSYTPVISNVNELPNSIEKLLSRYPHLTRVPGATDEVKHKFVHRIITDSDQTPIYVKPRRIGLAVRDAAEAALNKMLEDGTIRPSASPWSSALHLVPKRSGSWRPVGDYRLLNGVTKKDKYPLPFLSDFSSKLNGKRIFSTIDLKDAFFQIPIADEDIEKTCLATPFGNFEFTRMNFGLCGAAQTFQRFIDHVLRDLTVEKNKRKVTYFAYIDDILIASENESDHLQDLNALFEKLEENGLCINLQKCSFLRSELQFLGHKINSHGTLPLMEKVDAIKNYEKPLTVKGLRRFLGLVNFYHRYIDRAAEHLAPLTDLIRGNKNASSKRKVIWNSKADQAFSAAKKLLSESSLLHYPVIGAETSIAVDASDVAIGGVLQQYSDGHWKPISFFSRKLGKTQTKYSTFSKELLAAYSSVKYFRPYIEGTSFYLLTDHLPLTKAMHKKTQRDLPREERWLEFIAIFTTDIRHIKGTENIVADALSRHQEDSLPQIEPLPDTTDTAEPVELQLNSLFSNPLQQKILTAYQSDAELTDMLRGKYKSIVLTKIDDHYYHKNRMYVPVSLRRELFDQYHNSAHPGIRATRRHMTNKYFWPCINKHVGEWARQCIPCQRAKVVRHNKTTVQSIPPASAKFAEIHLDLVGPLPVNKNQRYLLTIIDRYTRWPEAIPVPDITATTVADAFISNWVARYGIPSSVTTDRGAQFNSQLWREMMSRLGCVSIKTTAFHPQGNGLVERLHRRLKDSLRCHAQGDAQHWIERLPLIMLHIRSALRDDATVSPAMAMYGTPLTLPGDMIHPPACRPMDVTSYTQQLMSYMQALAPAKSRSYPSSSYVDKTLLSATHVFVRNEAKRGLQPNYRGPFKVIARRPKYFKVDLPKGVDTVSIDRLKAAHLTDAFLQSGENPTMQEVIVPPVPIANSSNVTRDSPPQPRPEPDVSQTDEQNNENASNSHDGDKRIHTRLSNSSRYKNSRKYQASRYKTRYGRNVVQPQRLTYN